MLAMHNAHAWQVWLPGWVCLGRLLRHPREEKRRGRKGGGGRFISRLHTATANLYENLCDMLIHS